MTADPVPELTAAQRRLIVLVASGATVKQIAADPETRLHPGDVRGAISAVLATTGTRTPLHLAAWATAQRIVTRPAQLSGALLTTPALTRRQHQVLRGWAGGQTNADLAADFGIARTTLRTYGKAVLASLGVNCAPQAVVVGVLAGLVLLCDIGPSWPAESLANAVAPVSGRHTAGRTNTASSARPEQP